MRCDETAVAYLIRDRSWRRGCICLPGFRQTHDAEGGKAQRDVQVYYAEIGYEDT